MVDLEISSKQVVIAGITPDPVHCHRFSILTGKIGGRTDRAVPIQIETRSRRRKRGPGTAPFRSVSAALPRENCRILSAGRYSTSSQRQTIVSSSASERSSSRSSNASFIASPNSARFVAFCEKFSGGIDLACSRQARRSRLRRSPIRHPRCLSARRQQYTFSTDVFGIHQRQQIRFRYCSRAADASSRFGTRWYPQARIIAFDRPASFRYESVSTDFEPVRFH